MDSKKKSIPLAGPRGDTRQKHNKKIEKKFERITHLSKRALSNHLDRPEILQTNLRPAEPQKLGLRARMPPDFSQSAIFLHAREGPLELRTPTNASASVRKTVSSQLRDYAPDIQVDRSLKRKSVMRLQLHLCGCRAGTRLRRQIVWTAFIVDVICGLLRAWLRWQQQRGCWGRCWDRRRYVRGAREGGAIYDRTVIIHGGGGKSCEGEEERG